MFGQKRNYDFILFLPVVVVLLLILVRISGIQGVKKYKNHEYFVHATTNNRHTMKLEDAPIGTSIQIGSKTFTKIAANQYMQKAPICHTRVWDFDYTGTEQTWTAPANGMYKLEVWGAQGGKALCQGIICGEGGYGGYAVGVIKQNANATFYVVVGGAGDNAVIGKDSAGGYNGGGSGTWDTHDNETAGGGGGATHIANKTGLLSDFSGSKGNVLLVAGGGGGSSWYLRGGVGGGVNGGAAGGDQIATQTAGNAFGQGQNATGIGYDNGHGGGGGGYYGGYESNRSSDNLDQGGGGSGYIDSSNLISAVGITKHMTCYDCTTANDEATRTQSNTCVSNNPTADCAKTGHGHARITLLTGNEEDCYTPECPVGTAYSAKYGDCKPLESFTEVVQVTDFAYTGGEQTFMVPVDGVYKLEVYGASGGQGWQDHSLVYAAGKGGYAYGTAALTANIPLYIYVGGQGATPVGCTDGDGGWNGGGKGGNDSNCDTAFDTGGGGGGASDIRLTGGNWDDVKSLRSRVIVAGGGGGSNYAGVGGNGGGIQGQTGYRTPSLATQTSGYAFGSGKVGGTCTDGAGGGGGGYWGGTTGDGCTYGGGGGSSYVSGLIGCVAVQSESSSNPKSGCADGTTDVNCSRHYSSLVFTDAGTTAGVNSGDGHAHITRFEVPAGDCGLHATLTGANTCICARGYYADSSGATTTSVGGECLYRKCGSNTITGYAINCACKAGYQIEGQGTFADANFDYDCVACADNTVYNSTAKSCIATTMQAFTPAMCAAFPTPTEATGYTTIGALTDTRDNKTYVIRKFADGKCWMAQNLAYGNVSSAADFSKYSYTNQTASGVLGSGLYGVAASPGSGYEGYLYDWQAVMQRSDAYYGLAYSGPTGVQGICPTGWHVPTGGASGELQALSDATGTNAAFFAGGNFCASGTSCLAGRINGDGGSLLNQGSNLIVWSSTTNTNNSYFLYAYSGKVAPANSISRYYGFSVRCVKN